MKEYIQTEDIPEHFLEGSGARYKTEGLPVVEYELEDIPKLLNGELPWIFGLVQTQPKSEGGGSTWFRFTPEAKKVWNESKEAQEKTYWAKVEAQLDAAKRMFLDTLKKSPDPAGTIADRIRQAQWRLEPDKDPTAPSELGIDPRSHLKQAWLTLKRGHREYDLSAFKFHYHQLQADIEHRFLQWLRDFQQSNKPDMIAGQAFAFTADGKPIEKPALQTIVEYFNEQGAEVQLCANVSNEEVVLRVQVLKDNTDLEADAREADPSELQALFDAKFTKARDCNRFKTPQAFAKAEAKRLRKAWADDADRFPIAEQWFEHLERIASETTTDSPEQPERPNTPPQGNEGGTGAEIETQRNGIIFTDPDTRKAMFKGLKGFFQDKETELLTLLEGGTVDKPLHFTDRQNRLAEVFSRAHHWQKITGTKTDLQKWIARNFTYPHHRTKNPTPCNPETLRGIFSPKPETTDLPKNRRIEIEGLPYVPYADRVDRG